MTEKPSPFNEARPRTPRGEARQRENKAMKAMQDLLNLNEEEAFRQSLAVRFGIVPGNPKYDRILATWRELRRGKP
jgi:hypothetical protein